MKTGTAKQKLTAAMIDQTLEVALSAWSAVPYHTDNRETLPSERLEAAVEAVAHQALLLNLRAADHRRCLAKALEAVLQEKRDSFDQVKRMTDREWCEHYVDHSEPVDAWTDLECHAHRHG